MTLFDPQGAPDCPTATKLRDEIDKFADCQNAGICGVGTEGAWKHASGLSGPNWIE